VAAVEATESGWALIPEGFPEKYFYVREMSVSCATHPELDFGLSGIARTLTETADDFTDIEEYESRFKAHVFIPESNEPLPLVLVFHGYGDDHNLLSYRTATAWAEPESQAIRPCVVIAPVINTIYYGSEIARSRIYEGIIGAIDGLIDAGTVNSKRIYAMGNSFGGMSSIEMAEQYPDRVAAVMALCPALNYSRTGMAALAKMKDVPLFIAQAERDETIPVSVGRQAAEKLEKAGGTATLKVFTDAEMEAAGAVHGQEQTYSFHHAELALLENEDYAEWLFSFKRK
jgi:predicted peptidase